jgi:hypothetical protein
VEVVDVLEPVEVDEEDRDHPLRATRPHGRVLQPLMEEDAVRQARQGIVQGALAIALRRLPGLGARLRIEQIGGGDVCERLRRHHRLVVQRAGGLAVQIERAEPLIAVSQRKREHSDQAGLPGAHREVVEAGLFAKVGNADRLARVVRHHARSFAEIALQELVPERRCIRRGDMVRVAPGGDERHPCRCDR